MSTVLRKGMVGPRVKDLQKLLVHNNSHCRYYFGKIDGEFGSMTDHAVERAKLRLGYLKGEVNGRAGDKLIRYLKHPEDRPPDYKARAKKRHKALERAETTSTMAGEAWRYMISHLGDHETPPGSNHCFATEAWGHGDMPWCNVLVSLSYIHAKSQAFSAVKYRFQLVSAMYEDAKVGRNGLVLVPLREMKHGDIIVWNYPGGSLADHTTMFGWWLDNDHDLFIDCGGNEGASGVVKKDVNTLTYVRAAIRVVK